MNQNSKDALLYTTYFLGGCLLITGILEVPYLPAFVMGGAWGAYVLKKYKEHNGKQR